MSYIGKNPKVDSVKLDGSATVPTGASVEGQVYYNTGTGSISKGLKVYKNSQFVSIDKQLGDADTFHLLKASDLSVSEWSGARNSTSTSFLNQNSVPFETTTASGVAGTFSNSSTGDALLTDESADLVFAYKSSGTSDDAQEYFGIPLTIPKAFRGGNLVLSFVYRTENDGSAATLDGQFEVGILDKSTGNGGQTTSTNSTTDIAAGAAITVASKTGLAVNQRIRLEAGSQAAIGSPDATVVEAYITSVSSTANEITISEAWDTPHAAGAAVVSGWLTDVVPGQLPGADSDTDKQGKSFSLQFKTEDDTSDIVLWFQNKNTSSTDSFELFVDNILLSANKFLQASSQEGYEEKGQFHGGATSTSDTRVCRWTTEDFNTFDRLGTLTSTAANGVVFTANEKLYINCTACIQISNTDTQYLGLVVNSTQLTTGVYAIGNSTNSYKVKCFAGDNSGSNAMRWVNAAWSGVVEKGDVLRWQNDYNQDGAGGERVNFNARPYNSTVILLESQDEIFTDWVSDGTLSSHIESTGTNPTFGSTKQADDYKWRRVGSNMEIMITYYQDNAGTAGTGNYTVALPSGYSIDTTTMLVGSVPAGNAFHHGGTFSNAGLAIGGVGYIVGWGAAFATDSTGTTFGVVMGPAGAGGASLDGDTGAVWGVETNDQQFGSSGIGIRGVISLPIQGWNSNFNPLLSMPLVDFDHLENTYSAYIDTGGTIQSQSGNWLASASNSTGSYTLTYTSGFFSVAPTVNVTVDSTTNHGRIGQVVSYSATGSVVSSTNASSGAQTNNDCQGVMVTVMRQGVDYITPPQPTAAIIKPAVATAKAIFSSTTVNPVGSSSTGFVNLPLNTFEGETWFLTPGTGSLGVGGTNTDFTLEAGTYKIISSNPQYNCGNSANRLVGGSTFGDTYIIGQTGYSDNNYNTQVFSQMSGVLTLTSTTSFRVQANSTVTSTNAFGVANTELNSVYLQLTIEKLK